MAANGTRDLRATGLLGFAVASALSASAAAQQAPARVAVLEEIVVTAQKREEKLLDVPMSITALTGDAVNAQGATSLLDIASTVPSLSTLEYSPGQNRAQLRGISSSTGSATIGLYLDEAPINLDSVQTGPDLRFVDLERIEVLRGPQGTLYGEGSMGGTIKYVTRAPDLTRSSFGFDAAFGTVTDGSETYRGSVIANVPLVTDTLGVRLAGSWEQSPGWIDYPAIGRKDVNDGTSGVVRLKTLWKPTSDLNATLTLMYQKSDYDSQNFADENRQAPYVVLQPTTSRLKHANIVLDYDAGAFSVLGSTTYFERDDTQLFDVTGFFGPIYTLFGFPPGFVQSVTLPGDSGYRVFSQELRFASKGAGPWQWTTGAYYRDYRESVASTSVTTPDPLGVPVVASLSERTSKQAAVFGEVTYQFAPSWSATLGLRQFRDERASGGATANFGFPLPEPDNGDTFKSTNPRLVVSYRPSDASLVYVSAAKGFRSGGFNTVGGRPPGCSFPVAYDPEKLWTYELGGNVTLADGRFVLQSAVYRNQWRNIQSSIFCPGSQLTQTTNAGKASGTGIDLQLTWRPLDALSVSVAAGYNDSQYDVSGAAQNKGDQIDFAPPLTGSASADWTFQWTPSLPGRFHVDYQYTDDFSIALRNFPGSAPLAFSDAYGRLNARLSVLSGAWEFGIYGQNLTDESKAVMPPIGVLLVPVSMTPRNIGFSVRYNY